MLKIRILTIILWILGCSGLSAVAAEPQSYGPDEIIENPEGMLCFEQYEIPDTIWALMSGKSYKEGCPVGRESLRYLRLMHHDGRGAVRMGEMVSHADVADDLCRIFKELYLAGYPIERMVVIDRYGADDVASMEANNTSCFNFRKIAGSNRLSRHSLGKAVDINPLYNPWVKERKGGKPSVSPESGRRYADRTLKDTAYPLIDNRDESVKQFKNNGFIWGGDWKSIKDYQHFEKK